jgi:hypothetical protein
MNKPILLIIGCRKYRENLIKAMDRMTHESYKVIGVIGTDEPTTFDERLLMLHVQDTYEDLPKKIKAAFIWIRNNFPDSPGIFKTDDDIFFENQDMLAQIIIKLAPVPYWGIYRDKCSTGEVSGYRIDKFTDKSVRSTYQSAIYCYGAGYWISKAAIPLVCESVDHDTSILEDVCMGYTMNKANIVPLHIPIPCKELPR